MDQADKKKFIANLCDSVRDELVAKVEDMPDNWDGHELRQLIASKFNREAFDLIRGKRGRAFRNEILTRNL
jgi:hypothetical protein